jgi:cytochrome c oxidase subunit 2
MYFAAPVFAFVVAVLVYSVLRYRRAGAPDQDGPPLLGHGVVPVAWFGITSVLAVVLMINPGLTGLAEIMEEDPDVVVKVQGTRWTWIINYPEHGVSTLRELVLPVDQSVRFEITAADVIHSVWIPAFLMKLDAVPGSTTTFTIRPTALGDFETDDSLRLQCAEMCGRDHALRQLPIRVVTAEEFKAWIEGQVDQQPQTRTGTPEPRAPASRNTHQQHGR